MPSSYGGGACCSPASPAQRPYDIHSSSAVQSLVQLFSTVSVQYVPAWSKETVALLRKVSARPAQSAGRPDTRRCGGEGSPEREWARRGGLGGSAGLGGWAGHGGRGGQTRGLGQAAWSVSGPDSGGGWAAWRGWLDTGGRFLHPGLRVHLCPGSPPGLAPGSSSCSSSACVSAGAAVNPYYLIEASHFFRH